MTVSESDEKTVGMAPKPCPCSSAIEMILPEQPQRAHDDSATQSTGTSKNQTNTNSLQH